MAEKHPYTSGSSGLTQAINHLRRSFPAVVTSETLKKLGIAPNNETYIINILRFVKIIDADGKKTPKAASVFSKHGDAEFQKSFAELIEAAYSELFGLHGSSTWTLSNEQLVSYFRHTDQTSGIVGERQATTFRTLSALSGHGEAPPTKAAAARTREDKKKTPGRTAKAAKREPEVKVAPVLPTNGRDSGNVGLTVRIEINLPVADDQETYDRIFKSIRENLLRGD